jgi:hypothetical protein
MLFGIAFQDLGGFHHPHCFAKRMALAVAVLLPLKMQLLSCHHLYVIQHLGLLLFFNLMYCFGASYRRHMEHFTFRESLFH